MFMNTVRYGVNESYGISNDMCFCVHVCPAPAPFGGDFGLHPQEGSGGPVQCFLPFSTGSSRGNAEPTKSITQRVCASTVPMKRPAVVQFGIPVRFSVEAVSSMPHVQSTQHPTQGHGETISISGAHGAVAVPMHTQQLFGPSGENAKYACNLTPTYVYYVSMISK